MKRKIWVLAALVLGLATASRADFLLWLDAPAKRTNPNDPQVKTLTPGGGAGNTSTSSATPSQTTMGSPSVTPSATQTATFPNSPTNTPFAGSPTNTALPSATATPSNSSSPSATPTATNSPTPSYLLYDGETAGALAADLSIAGIPPAGGTATFVEQAGTGGCGANFLHFEGTAPAAAYFVGGQALWTAPKDVSTRTLLKFRFRLGGQSGGAGKPAVRILVQLIGSAAAPNDSSKSVTVTAYLDTFTALAPNVWYGATVPLTEFMGGDNGGGGSMSAGDLSTLKGVQFKPESRSYETDGSITSATFDVDCIDFATGSATVRSVGYVFSDGEAVNGANDWGSGYWYTFSDQDLPDWAAGTCAPDTATSRTFPPSAAVVPVEDPVNSALPSSSSIGGSGGLAMHFRGHKGGICTGQYSYAGMGVAVNATSTLKITLNDAASQMTGLKIKYMVGAGNSAAQNYLVMFVSDIASPCGGCEWQHRVYTTASGIAGSDNMAATNTWKEFTIPFPTVGALGSAGNNCWTWEGADIGWGQPCWAGGFSAWSDTVVSMSIAPEVRNEDFDIWVDDITFY